MFKKLFGGKQEEVKEPPKPKFNELSSEQLKELQKEFKKKLNKEIREVDKQIYQTEQLKKKAEESLQKELKRGAQADKFVKQTYAKQIVQCNKNKERTMQNKYKIVNLQYSLDGMLSNIKMAQIMGQSSDLLKNINQCMNIKEMNKTMMELQKDMMQFGMIQEMIDETMDNVGDSNLDSNVNENDIDAIINAEEAKIQNKNAPQANINTNAQVNNNFEDMEKNLAKLME